MLVNPDFISRGKGWPIASRALGLTLNIPLVVTVITTGGYTTNGDGGGGTYIRAGSAPAHNAYFQSNDGAYWVLSVPSANFRMLGAAGNGVTDDWASVNNTIQFASLTGTPVEPTNGNYLLNTNNGSIVLENVTIRGMGVMDGANATGLDVGSNFYITGTTNSAFLQRRGCLVTGMGYYYPLQVDSATPAAYPFTVKIDVSNGPVQGVKYIGNFVYNAFNFFDTVDVGGNLGDIEIAHNSIYAINQVFNIPNNLEVINIHHNFISFGLWLAATEAGCRGYTRANGEVVKHNGGDGFYFETNLIYGYLYGYHGTGGVLFNPTIFNNKFDNVRYCIAVDGAAQLTQFSFNDNLFVAYNNQNTALPGAGISITATGAFHDGIIGLNQLSTCTGDHIVINTVSGGNIEISDNRCTGAGAFQASGLFASVKLNCANMNVDVDAGYMQGQGNALVHGVYAFAVADLKVENVRYLNQQSCLNIAAATSVTTCGNKSRGTVGNLADVISGVSGNIWQTGNDWDKASLSSTKPAWLVRKNASQTFNSGTLTDVVFGTEQYDKGNNFVSPTLTFTKSGRYKFEVMLTHDATGTAGDRWQLLLRNPGGTPLGCSYKMINDVNSVSLSGELQIDIAVNPTVVLSVQRVSGAGNFVTLNDSNVNYMSGSFID